MTSRRHAWLALLFNLGIPLAGLGLSILVLAASRHPAAYGATSLALTATGLGLFLSAKRSVLRQRVYVSFGPSRMTETNRRLYWAGFLLMALGVLSSGVLLFSPS